MELIQLEYFRKVAYEESISRAARTLHISQPALSISISKLEEELGVHLFDRVSGHIRLNNMGRIYLRRVEQVFLNLREASLELTNQEDIFLSEISIAGTTMGMCPIAIETFIQAHPTQPLSFFIYSDDEIKRQLEQGELDMALCARQILGHDILWTPLLEERLVILAPESHPLCRRKYVEVSDLKDERFVVQRSASNLNGEYSAVFENAGYQPKTSVVTNELELAIRSVDAGAGIMVASFLTAARLTHNSAPAMIPLKTDRFSRTVGIARLQGHFFTRPVWEFYNFIVEYYREIELYQEKIFRGVYDHSSGA